MIIQHSLDLLRHLSELEGQMAALDGLMEELQLPHDREEVLVRLIARQLPKSNK